jgi:hypothetical protein
MPTYTFHNTETGEVFDKLMKMSEREDFLKENPQLETIIGAPQLIDPVRLGVRKPDQGFKEVLQKIHEKTAGSDLKAMGKI